jgi:hypothetical protein
MALIERYREPTAGELRYFGLMLAGFLGLVGGLIWWQAGSPVSAGIIWAVGVTVAVLCYALPPLRRVLFLAWMAAVFPLGWAISHLLLALIYYLIFTPVGLAMRLFGRDPLQRRFDREAPTYWIEHNPADDPARYFRQF